MKLLFSYLHRQRYWAALYILLVSMAFPWKP